MERTGAAAVIIGNEVLTAKVQDLNGPHLIKRLREVGIPLHSVEIVRDDVDAIVSAGARGPGDGGGHAAGGRAGGRGAATPRRGPGIRC